MRAGSFTGGHSSPGEAERAFGWLYATRTRIFNDALYRYQKVLTEKAKDLFPLAVAKTGG